MKYFPPPRRRTSTSGLSSPKKIVLYPGCKHGLDQCREPVDADLLDWIRNVTVRRA